MPIRLPRIPTALLALTFSAVTHTHLGAQASATLPTGYDATEGEGYHWSGWSNDGVTTKRFLPARNVYLYDNPFASIRSVRTISLRRDSTITSSFVAFRQSVRWYLSTDGAGTARQPVKSFAAAHGANVRLVVGSATTPGTLDFKATLAGRGTPSPFDVVAPLSSPFIIPANAATIVFENRHYSSTGTVGTWYVDAYSRDVTPRRGLYRYISGSTCIPGSSHTFDADSWPRARLRSAFLSRKPGAPIVGFLGGAFPTPIPIAGTGCWIYVNPLVTLATLAANDAVGTASFDWGAVPNSQVLVGARIWLQYGAVFVGGPIQGTAGLSRGGEVTIGGGYPAALVASAIYSYGPSVAATGGPDKVVLAANLSPRAPILRLGF